MTAKPAREPKATERELLQLLDRRHAKTGNGGSGEYAFLTHVRNDGGFSATRTFDAMSVALWPSRGYALHVYEVKVSRSDWLRELKDPAKSEAAWAIGDLFSIVATAGVVDVAELPPGWGLIEAHGAKVVDAELVGRRLRTTRSADWHGDKRSKSAESSISRGLLVAMLRRAGAVPDQQTPSEKIIGDAVAKAVEENTERWQRSLEQHRQQSAQLEEDVRTFYRASGIQISRGGLGRRPGDLEELGQRVRTALADEGHEQRVRANLERTRDQLRQAADHLQAVIDSGPSAGTVST